jgi:hypothetical protein
LAWQQRVNKEVGKAETFERNYYPRVEGSDSPLKGLVDKYSCPYSFSDPNGIAKYDLKNTVNDMEVTQKNKAKRIENYRKSCSNLPAFSGTQTYQTTAQSMLSPNGSSKNLAKMKLHGSPKSDELKALLAKTDSKDVFAGDRYPRPKNFFYQAYLAKSKLDTLSQAGSKMSRTRSSRHLGKVHYPPGHPKHQNLSKLPNIQSKRFNEDTMSQYSKRSSASKKPLLMSSQKLQGAHSASFLPQNAINQSKKIDGSHLSQVPDRADDLKKMLIDTIEHMDDKEVEVMKSAIDSVKHGEHRSRQGCSTMGIDTLNIIVTV